jgi:putative holliday junction resolvase
MWLVCFQTEKRYKMSLLLWYATRMRRLGIDFGTKNIGIALTDESGSMAFPHAVIPNNEKTLPTIIVLLKEKEVQEVVIGHSLNKDGNANALHRAVEELMTDLTLAVGLPIHLEPEQYSTQQALRIQGRTTKTDAAAAALILDSFITKHTTL